MYESLEKDPYHDRIACFGSFSNNHPVCMKRCGCRIRCAVATVEILKMEVLQEWVDTDHSDILSN